ncbi:dihydrofolate reductase [Phocaeicola sp.]
MSNICIIVAISRSHAIGFENQLLYWLPNDLKRFKALTTGHTIIMGRKTFESLPKGALPNRRNIILTRQKGTEFTGAECFPSLAEALSHCEGEEEVFVMGGASVYKEALPLANQLYITLIDDDSKEADVFFPKIDEDLWKETGREDHQPDEKHLYPYSFINYERRK